jgi:outer membrane lipoprotein carrier protein
MQRRLLITSIGLAMLAPVTGSAAPGGSAPSSPAAPPGQINANDLADRIQNFYNKTATFQANFRQRYWIEAYKRTKDSSGNVVFQKPGKMSWRYTNNGNRVVSDGKIIKIYEKENNQMYEQPVDKSQYPAALAFLVGGGNLRQSFRLKMLDAKSMGFEGGFVLMGIPKKATPAYQKIFLYVDAASYQVRRVLLLDAQRNRNRFDFVAPVVNKEIPPAEFTFVPPKGTQVIKP